MTHVSMTILSSSHEYPFWIFMLPHLQRHPTLPYWWETGMKEAAKRKHISDLCPTLCSCGYRENKWLDINQWRIVSSPLFISQQWIMHFKVKVWWQVFCSIFEQFFNTSACFLLPKVYAVFECLFLMQICSLWLDMHSQNVKWSASWDAFSWRCQNWLIHHSYSSNTEAFSDLPYP